MEANKMMSPFRFMASHILELHIDNTYIQLDDSPINQKSVNISHKVPEIVEQDDSWIGLVELSIKVNISENNEEIVDVPPSKYSLDMKIEGGFTAGKDMPKEEFEQMLHINGTAALYSIARGFIISTSSQTLVSGQVVLPLLNFTK